MITAPLLKLCDHVTFFGQRNVSRSDVFYFWMKEVWARYSLSPSLPWPTLKLSVEK